MSEVGIYEVMSQGGALAHRVVILMNWCDQVAETYSKVTVPV